MNQKSLVIVQYAGDYAEAYLRLANGGDENYYAQRYSIDVVGSMVSPATRVTTICCTADREYAVVLPNGVRAINMLADKRGVDQRRVWEVVRRCEPTHLLLRSPQTTLLRHALSHKSIKTVLLTIADSFRIDGLRARWQAWQLRHLLSHPRVAYVGNHGVCASESLRRLGVDAKKIVPWDWPHEITPHQFAPKKSSAGGGVWSVVFVGAIMESKGIGDVIRAIGVANRLGARVRLTYAGRGDTELFTALVNELGLSELVTYLGAITHSQVVPLMRDADLVVVPSRHDYPEGFPMTIYEALSSRTPIIASDHPMFARHLLDTGSALVYPAGDHEALAKAIKRLMDDPKLYEQLSARSLAAWQKLQLPVTWGHLVEAWFADSPGGLAEIAAFTLAKHECLKP